MVIEVFWCSVFAVSLMLDGSGKCVAGQIFPLLLGSPSSLFFLYCNRRCGFGMIPFTSPGIVCQSLQKVIVCVLKYSVCAFLHFFLMLKKSVACIHTICFDQTLPVSSSPAPPLFPSTTFSSRLYTLFSPTFSDY